MTRVLAAAVVVAQLLDLVTWLAMPRAAEVNPIARALHSQDAWLVKAALLLLVITVELGLRLPREPMHKRWRMPEWRIPEWVYVDVAEFVAVLAIAAGCLGAGSNIAAISWVNAAEAPRPATQPAPVTSGGTGNEQGTQAPAAESRTPAPRQSAPGSSVRGLASWYGVDGDVAAAGPELRHGHWRGSLVAVCADRCVTVRIVDWCQCYSGQRSERVIDLSPSAFARLAPLSTGLIHVTVSAVHVTPPATDTE